MKWRSSVALLALALGLMAFVWFWDSGQKSTREAELAENRLFDFDAAAVRWIEIDQAGGTLRFERRAAAPAPPAAAPAPAAGGAPAADTTAVPAPEAWYLVRPFQDRADPSLLDGIADRIARLESSRRLGVPDEDGEVVPAPADDAAGLAPARITLRFGTGSAGQPAGSSSVPPVASAEHTLQVGREIPGTRSVYLRISGRPGLDVTEQGLTEGLDRAPDDWRDRALFDVTTLDLGRVEIVSPGGTLRFERSGESWRVGAPYRDEAAGSKVQSLLFTLTGLHAVSFAPAEDPAGLAALLGAPWKIDLARRDGSPAGNVSIGGPVEGSGTRLWARAAGRQGLVQVDRAVLDTLGTQPAGFRSLQAFTIGEFSAAKISLEKAGTTLAFEFKDEGWVATSPADLKPVAGTVEGTVNAAAGLQAAAVEGPAGSLAPLGLDPPLAKITLVSRDDESGNEPARTETLRLGKAAGAPGQIYALRDGRPWVLLVPDTILSRFDRKLYETPPQDTAAGAEMPGSVGTP